MAPFDKKLLQISFLLTIFFIQLTAKNYYVRKSGDDNNDGLSPKVTSIFSELRFKVPKNVESI